jgi:hypothetical protein
MDKVSAVWLSHNDPLHIALDLRPNAFLKEEVNKERRTSKIIFPFKLLE